MAALVGAESYLGAFLRILYIILSYLAFIVVFPVLALHRKTRNGLLQRFGFYSPDKLKPNGEPRIWMHGASAGDLLALSPMVKLLRMRFPGCSIILSTTTNTGYMMASERLASQFDAVVYGPYDLWGTTRRAVRALNPDLLILEYTEIWPNLIRAAKRHGARVVLTNGRFSPEHLGRYRFFFGLIGNPLQDIDLFLMREDDEAERVLGLGAPLERVWVTGNTKFDALTSPYTEESDDPALREALGLRPGTPVLIAGSTHEGEEDKLFGIYKRLLLEHPRLRLVVAPRYVDRATKIAASAVAQGLTSALRSQGNTKEAQVVILDTIGELSRAYRLATLVFVGGSFTTRGGQNILEPAAQGRPVLFGPHMENFHDSVQVLIGRGGIQVNDAEHLFRLISELLARPDTTHSLGELARNAVRQVSGASVRNIEHIERLLSNSPGNRSFPLRQPATG